MSALSLVTGSEHVSYSALSSLIKCGEAYNLERIYKVQQRGAWWFLGGSAFHEATESLDWNVGGVTPDEAWQVAWEGQLLELTEEESSLRAAKGGTEGRAWWEENGPLFVRSWLKWREKRYDEGWRLLVLDGQPAVELPFDITLGSTLVKGFIDRVYVKPDGTLLIDDYKSGSTDPDSGLQLGVYAAAMAVQYDTSVILGAYYMARKGKNLREQSLMHYTPALLGEWFDKARLIIEQRLFLPNVSRMCNSCGVRSNCAAHGGSTANLLPDPFRRVALA